MLPAYCAWVIGAASQGRAAHCAGPVVRPCVQAEEQETDAFKNRKRAITKSMKFDSKLYDPLPNFERNSTTYELIPNKSSLGINPNSGKSRTGNRRPQNRWKTGPMKALVSFWLIDETLSANLVYQSNYEIGGTFQVVEQMKIMTWRWCCHGDDKVLGLGKEERKTKDSRQRWNL